MTKMRELFYLALIMAASATAVYGGYRVADAGTDVHCLVQANRTMQIHLFVAPEAIREVKAPNGDLSTQVQTADGQVHAIEFPGYCPERVKRVSSGG